MDCMHHCLQDGFGTATHVREHFGEQFCAREDESEDEDEREEQEEEEWVGEACGVGEEQVFVS